MNDDHISTPEVPPDAHCLDCGYQLRGLPENRCPECGQTFDPRDLRTMYVGLPMPRWAARLDRPPGRGSELLTYRAAAALLWGESWLVGGVYVTLAGAILALLCIGYRWARGAIRWFLTRRYQRRYEQSHRPSRAVLVLCAMLLICIFGFPHHVSLWLHKPLLSRFVRHIHSEIPLFEAEKISKRRLIGLLYVHDTWLSPSQVVMLIGPNGIVLYSPYSDDYDVEVIDPHVYLRTRAGIRVRGG